MWNVLFLMPSSKIAKLDRAALRQSKTLEAGRGVNQEVEVEEVNGKNGIAKVEDLNAPDYKGMYEREQEQNEMLRNELKLLRHTLDVEVRETQRRHDIIWDMET